MTGAAAPYVQRGRPGSEREEVTDNTALVSLDVWVGVEAETGRGGGRGFLRVVLDAFDEEPRTIVWFAVRLGPSTFAILDALPDEDARRAHLGGKVGRFSGPPEVGRFDVLAAKPPVVAASG